MTHATLSKFMNVMLQEQSLTDLEINQVDAGQEIANRKRGKYVRYDIRLKNVVSNFPGDNYSASDMIDYLKNIAMNIPL